MVFGGLGKDSPWFCSPMGRKEVSMISKIWNGVCGLVGKAVEAAKRPAAYVVAFVFSLSTLLGNAVVFAQGGNANSVTFTPIVEFGEIFTSITTTLGPLVAAALGLGLAIWGARYVFSIIKSMGR